MMRTKTMADNGLNSIRAASLNLCVPVEELLALLSIRKHVSNYEKSLKDLDYLIAAGDMMEHLLSEDPNPVHQFAVKQWKKYRTD